MKEVIKEWINFIGSFSMANGLEYAIIEKMMRGGNE